MTKSIPCVLAFAVTSSLVLAQAPAPGGWSMKPGSGLQYDGGDAFGLKWTNRLQVHWTFANNENATDNNNFDVRRARTQLSGHVFSRNISYMLNLDGVDSGATGDGNLKDGWVQWNFSNSDDGGTIGLRVGQGKTQYGLEATTSSGGLWFVERSSAARAFSDARSTGAWLNGVMLDHKLRWSAGAMNGDAAAGVSSDILDRGEEGSNSDNELSYVLAVNFDPLGDFFGGKQTRESLRQGDWRTDDDSVRGTIGAALALGNSPNSVAAGPDVESTSININTAWTFSRFNVLGEYFMRTDETQGVNDEEEPTGWAVSLGYLLPKNGDSAIQWGFGVRVNEIETDNNGAGPVDFLTGGQGIGSVDGTAREISLVANAFYHSHNCKTQIEYTHQNIEPTTGSDTTNHLIRVGFQLEF